MRQYRVTGRLKHGSRWHDPGSLLELDDGEGYALEAAGAPVKLIDSKMDSVKTPEATAAPPESHDETPPENAGETLPKKQNEPHRKTPKGK